MVLLNMKMPIDCAECRFCDLRDNYGGWVRWECTVIKRLVRDRSKRLDDCPLEDANQYDDDLR